MNPSLENFVRATYKPADRQSKKGEEIVCLIGEDVTISTNLLEGFCFQQLSEDDCDLVRFAGVVTYADRAIRRHRSEGWRRQIAVSMPVGNPNFWERSAVTSALVGALAYLTGDAWRFEFTRRTTSSLALEQKELNLAETATVVVPFSSGLDSFAQSKLLKADGFTETPIRITAMNSGVTGDRTWLLDADGSRYRRVSVPVGFGKLDHPDSTYRSRTFLFAILAGLAARLARSSCIIIPEAGQGSFGPSLTPVGNESPHRGSHPGFTRRMSNLFKAFWGEKIDFRHPQLWRTKGQVLKRLKEKELLDGWLDTHSCSQGPRQILTERHKKLHCGLCAGCLLRRMSARTAGLSEPPDHYFWENLDSPSLVGALCSDALRAPSRNDQDIAVHAVMAMELLARMTGATESALMTQKQNLYEAFPDQQLEHEQEHLRVLLAEHTREWRTFTAELKSDSWINQQIAVL